MAPFQLDDTCTSVNTVGTTVQATVNNQGFNVADFYESPLMYKKKLHEYAQKSSLPLLVYENVNEGFPHAPKFRSTVLVDNTKYTSQRTYTDCKAAEQEAAKLAYESISESTKNEDFSSIYQNPILCKSILHEYAIKMNIGVPKYQTTYAEGPRPVFISSFVFGGKTYTGEVAQSKKVAEQLVACTAIRSLLRSDSGTLAQIIKSKDKLYASLHGKKYFGNEAISTIAVRQEDQPQKEDSVHVAGPSQQQEASIETEIATFNAGLGRTTDAISGAKQKIGINSWEQGNKRSPQV